jgi:hypothetical protein
VFVVHSDDSRCVKHSVWKNMSDYADSERKKEVYFSINEKITYVEYLIAILGLIAIFLFFYVLSMVISCVYLCK